MNSNGNLTGKVIPLVIKEKSSSSAMEGNNIKKVFEKLKKNINIFNYKINL